MIMIHIRILKWIVILRIFRRSFKLFLFSLKNYRIRSCLSINWKLDIKIHRLLMFLITGMTRLCFDKYLTMLSKRIRFRGWGFSWMVCSVLMISTSRWSQKTYYVLLPWWSKKVSAALLLRHPNQRRRTRKMTIKAMKILTNIPFLDISVIFVISNPSKMWNIIAMTVKISMFVTNALNVLNNSMSTQISKRK